MFPFALHLHARCYWEQLGSLEYLQLVILGTCSNGCSVFSILCKDFLYSYFIVYGTQKQEKAGGDSLDWKCSKGDKLIEAKATMVAQVSDFISAVVLHYRALFMDEIQLRVSHHSLLRLSGLLLVNILDHTTI